MSLTELHDRLDERFRLLTGAEQLLLGRLSVFVGGFDLATAEVVCGSGDLDVLDIADSRYIAASLDRVPQVSDSIRCRDDIRAVQF
jgi:predicted ATPase